MSFALKENDAAQIDGHPQQEPPSFIVGLDGDDHWIVVETHGLCGGIFVDEAAAMRYARAESRGRPDAIRLAPSLLVLNMEARSGLRARR